MADQTASSVTRALGADSPPKSVAPPSQPVDDHASTQSLRRAKCTVRVIVATNRAIRHAVDEADFYRQICQVAVESGGYRMAWIGVAEQDAASTVRPVAHAGIGADFVASLQISWSIDAEHMGPAAVALQTGVISMVPDIAADPRFDAWRAQFEQFGIASIVALPLCSDGHLYGALLLYAGDTAPFDAEEVELLLELAALVEHGIVFLHDQAARRNAEATLTGFLDNAPSPIFVVDNEDRYLLINRAWEEALGYTRAEVIGRTVQELFPVGVDLAPLALHDTLRASGDTVTLAEALPTRDGLRHFQTVKFLLDPAAGVIGGIATDVTGRKVAEEEVRRLNAELAHLVELRTQALEVAVDNLTRSDFELRRKDELLQHVLQLLPVGVWIVDAQGQSLEANPAAARIWGSDLVADTSGFSTYRAWRLPERVPLSGEDCALMRALREGITTLDDELEIERHDGTRRTILDSAMPIRSQDGAIVGAVTVNLDITARKAAEEALRANEARLHMLLARSPAAIFVSDATRAGSLRFVSASIVQLIGYRPEEFLDVPGFWSSHMHPEDYVRVLIEVSESPSLVDQTQEFRFRHRDGHYVWLRSGLALIRDSAGKRVEVVGYVVDVTKRKQMEQVLQENRDALRDANDALALALRTKDEFMASVSHELRTPLAAILGLTESLQEYVYGQLNQRQLGAIQALEESSRHLLDMINDILDVAKSDLGQMTLQIEPVDVDTVCSASLRLVESMARQKGLRLQFACDPIDMVTAAEPRRLRQILVNLLSNAVKFTPSGGEAGLSVRGDRAAGVIRFTVWDTGIGIAPEDVDRLFQPFVQLNTGLSRHFGGTGLGLVLVKRLTEAHGGRVEVESAPGAGSRFIVTLGWSPPPGVDDGAGDQGASEDVLFDPSLLVAGRPCVLLAEDSEFTLVAYRDYLTRAGFRVEVARNGFEAIAKARIVHPAVILMDIQMPGMDGYEAIRHLRADPDPDVADVPILALTALAMPGDRERCLAAGASIYLAKPISLPSLTAHLKAQVKQ